MKSKIKRIEKESEIEIGKVYLEIPRNGCSSTTPIENISSRYKITSLPHAYDGPSSCLKGTRWVRAQHIIEDNYHLGTDTISLSDMGITDKPYNDHKFYLMPKGEYKKIKGMSIAEFEHYIK